MYLAKRAVLVDEGMPDVHRHDTPAVAAIDDADDGADDA